MDRSPLSPPINKDLLAITQLVKDQIEYMEVDLEAQLDDIVSMMFDAYDFDYSRLLERTEIRRMVDDICKEFGMAVFSDVHLDNFIRVVDENCDDRFSREELAQIIKPVLRKQLQY